MSPRILETVCILIATKLPEKTREDCTPQAFDAVVLGQRMYLWRSEVESRRHHPCKTHKLPVIASNAWETEFDLLVIISLGYKMLDTE